MSLRERPAVAVFVASVLLMAAVGTAVVLLSPSTALPVGASVATGDSMGEAQPQVVVYGPGELAEGTTAVFQTSDGWLRHQLVERTDAGWITQGTNEPHTDQWSGGPGAGVAPVTEEQIAGVVYAAVPLTWVGGALAALLIALASLGLHRTRETWEPPAARALSAGRGVTSRLSTEHTVPVAVALLVVLSLSAPYLSPAGIALADDHTDGDNVIESFEDGSLTDTWTVQDGSPNATDKFAIDGTYSSFFQGSNSDQALIDITHTKYEKVSVWYRPTTSDMGSLTGWGLSGGTNLVEFEMDARFGAEMNVTLQGPGGQLCSSLATLSPDTWYKFQLSNIDYAADEVTAVVKDADGNELGSCTSSLSFDATSVGQLDASAFGSGSMYADYWAVNGSQLGQPVSGKVTSADGSGVDGATLELLDSSDSVIATTTSSSDGSYQFDSVSDATDYQIRAEASGYQSKTSDSFDVAGSPRTVNFTLSGSFTGQVVDQSGDPVAGARVAMVGYDYSNLSGTIEQKRAEAQSIREQIQDVEPPNFDQDAQLFGGSDALQDKPVYAVAHSYDAFDAGAPPGLFGDLTNPSDDPDLRPPDLVHSTDDALVITLWDPSSNSFPQDAIDEELPGSTTTGEVVIKRIDASNDPLDTTRTETRDVFRTSSGFITTKNHEAVVLNDPAPGFYRVHPAGQPGAAYTFAVSEDGTVDSVLQNDPFVVSLKNEAGDLSARAEALQEELTQRQRAKLFTTTADANGEFAFALDEDTYQEVDIKAYREPSGLEDFQGDIPDEQDIKSYYNETIQDIREQELDTESGRDALRRACNGASTDLGAAYVPGPTQTVRPPADVTVTTFRASIPDTVGLADRQCLEADLLNSLANTSLADSIPNLQGRLANASREDLEQIYESVQSNSLENSRVCAETGREVFGEVPAACNVDSDEAPEPTDINNDGILEIENPTDTGPEYIPLAPTDGTYTNVSDDGPLSGIGDDTPPNVDGNTTAGDVTEGLTEAEIRDIVAAMQEADDTVGDTAPTGTPEVDTTNETVSVNFPVEADLSGTPGINLVARYSNGTERVLSPSSKYVSVSTNSVGADIVRVQEYPLGDAASVAFELDVATAEDTASETARVTNPAFSGRLPALGHVRVSASQPGVGDSVTVEPGAAPQSRARFGGLESAQAYAPNGSAVPTTLDGDGAQFTTVAAGPHRVEFAVSNAAGRTFNETVLVDAGRQTVNRPPTLRGQTGALGSYAVATDGLEAGRLEPAAGGNLIEADAVLPQNADVPPRVHVHENGVDAERSHRTQFRLLRGANRQQVEQRTTLVLHAGHLSENALVYRNGEAMVKGTGSTGLIEVTSANGSYTIMSPTTADGTVTIKTVNDPGFLESAWFSIQTTLPDIPFLFLFGKGGLIGVAIFGVRRRDPPGGRGGAGGQGGATA